MNTGYYKCRVRKRRQNGHSNVYVHLSNGQCLACVHPIWDALGYLGEHEGSVRVARDVASSISSYLSALPTIQVHPKLDGRTLDIVHCF